MIQIRAHSCTHSVTYPNTLRWQYCVCVVGKWQWRSVMVKHTIAESHQQLDGSYDPHRHVILGVRSPAFGVVVLVYIEATVSAARHEQVSILRQVAHQPYSGLVRSLAQTGKPFLRTQHTLSETDTYRYKTIQEHKNILT